MPVRQFIYKGTRFSTELEARWAVALDGIGLSYKYCIQPSDHDPFSEETTFFLPAINKYAIVFCEKPTSSEIEELQSKAEIFEQEYLLLIGPPSNRAYFAITDGSEGYRTMDYLIFDGTYESEGRLFTCPGDCNFPGPGEEDWGYSQAVDDALRYNFNSFYLTGPRVGEKDFGSWKIEGDELVLKEDHTRCIDFEQCNSSAQILDWIFHYRGRLNQRQIVDLLQAFESILHPRKNYCSFGQDKRISGLTLLNQWLTAKPQRKPIKPSVRFQILKRDNYRCQMCGVTAKDGATLEIDHIIPVSKGGTNDADNLQVLCRDCNAGKSDQWQ